MKLDERYRLAAAIACPAMIESGFTSVVGIIDSLMVSSLGTYAVAAVGLCNQPKLAAFSFFFALNIAVSALTARRKGEGQTDAMHQIVVCALVISAVFGIVIGLAGFIGADRIIRLCGSDRDTHRDAVAYFRIIMAGTAVQALSFTINAALRGTGCTAAVMRINVASQCLNLVGNYLLIGGHFGFPAMGTAGAAAATVLSYLAALILGIACILEKKYDIRIDYLIKAARSRCPGALRKIWRLQLPSLAEQILMRIGFLATAVMAARLGTEAFAANQAGMNIFNLTYAFGEGMQVAAVSLVGRSLGEKNAEAAGSYLSVLLRGGLLISAVLSVLYLTGAAFYMGLYFDGEEILETGKRIMYVSAVIVYIQMLQQTVTGGLKGAGDMVYITCSTIVSVTLIRPLSTYLLCYTAGMGVLGCWFGILLDQSCRLAFVTWRYRKNKWQAIGI